MSVYCRVAHPILLLRTLSTISIHRDCWATIIFTDSAVVLHVEGVEQSTTATAMLPKNLFSEYQVTDAKFAVHVPTFIDALLLLGQAALSTSSTCVVLAYPVSDGRLAVELTDTSAGGMTDEYGLDMNDMGRDSNAAGRRTLQSKLVTRPVRHNLLDLRFRDALVEAEAVMLGDVVRDIIGDLSVAQCAETCITIAPQAGVMFSGVKGPFSDVDVLVRNNAEALFSIRGAEAWRGREARTRVSTAHLAVACGAKGGAGLSSGGGGSGGVSGKARGGGGYGGMGSAAESLIAIGAGAASSSGGAPLGGFERLELQVNAHKQLCITHTQRDADVNVTVTIVLMPLRNFDDE